MPLHTTDRVVAHLLLSQIYREWGREDAAASILNKLEEHLSSLEKFGKRLPVIRQIAYRLALERHALGDNAGAVYLIRGSVTGEAYGIGFFPFRSRTPGPPPFSSMNSMPAVSNARLTTSSVAQRGVP